MVARTELGAGDVHTTYGRHVHSRRKPQRAFQPGALRVSELHSRLGGACDAGSGAHLPRREGEGSSGV
jgi:hypothetical protein